MNSYQFSSSSSSDDELEQIINSCDVEQQLVAQHLYNNNLALSKNFECQSSTTERRGLVPGHNVIHRECVEAAQRLFRDNFSENPTFLERMFRRRFRMSRNLFIRIVEAVKNYDDYFVQRRYCTGKKGLSTLQKITRAFRILAYSASADALDEYLNIGESTALECLRRFCRAIIKIFSDVYLRSPNASDISRLLYIGKKRGFPEMLGSLDCMHWKWKNYPTSWAGQYAGRSGNPTKILEIVADYDLWIWHAYFGMPGSNNDINVLERSHLFSNLARGIAPQTYYVIDGKEYDVGYYLADGIYPKWSTLIQTITDPRTAKKKYFTTKQESCRKDVERAFGVLQSHFAIVANPALYWDKNILQDIMNTCIIMHNMIIEDERDLDAPIEAQREARAPEDFEMVTNPTEAFEAFIKRYKKIKDKAAHNALQDALIHHLWGEFLNSED